MTTPRLQAPLALFTLALSLHWANASAATPVTVPVVLSITTNTAEITGFSRIGVHRNLPPNHDEGMFAKENYAIENAAPGMARDTAVFVASLPPGDYNFSYFMSVQGKYLSAKDKAILGNFTVAAGKPVDLGRLVLTPVNDKVIIGRVSGSASNLDMLRRSLPAQAALFTGAAAPGWNEPILKDQSLERLARAATVGADCPTERADGTVFAASRLGTILIRSPAGNWRGVHGPALESLLCVLPVDLPDTEAVAVGELGTLVRKPRGQDVLVPIDPGNLPLGSLSGIQGSPAAGWFVKHQQGDNVTLFRSPTLDAGTWTPMLKTDARLNDRHRRSTMFLWQTPTGMGYAGAQGPIKSFDQATGQWNDIALPPAHHRLMNVFSATNGELSINAAKGNPFINLIESSFVSRDRGATWKAIASPIKNYSPPVQILHDKTLMIIGINSTSLLTSTDDGVTWTETGTVSKGGTTFPLRSGALLDIEDGRHGWFLINASPDNGKQWSAEYSTVNHKAFAAEKKDK